MEKFVDRHTAGIALAEQLKDYAKQPGVIILALPRGGVPVAYEIARALDVPLDVFIVRKLGVPGHAELAMGAIAMGDVTFFNDEIIALLKLTEPSITKVIQAEKEEIKRRQELYRKNQPLPSLQGKTIILVDDGLATGATMFAALKALRIQRPAKIIVAIPVAAHSSYRELSKLADKVICPLKPIDFYAVGQWYKDFSQTTDEEVSELLTAAKQKNTTSAQCQ